MVRVVRLKVYVTLRLRLNLNEVDFVVFRQTFGYLAKSLPEVL